MAKYFNNKDQQYTMTIFPNQDNKSTSDPNHLPLTEDDDELNLADEDEVLVFAEENSKPDRNLGGSSTATMEEDSQSPFLKLTTTTWKIMIVDDDPDVHAVTQLALRGFTFQHKPLPFFSAYSGQAAKELLTRHPDTALILLDVIMEKNDSGLEVVKYIREILQNNLIRIILRTGQPGDAPEESVILNYDINDYKLKTELTQRNLFITLVAGLRAYQDLVTLELNKRFAKQILEAIPVGVAVHNVDGSMHYANKRAIQLLGQGIIPNAPPAKLIEVYQLCLAGTQQPYPNDRAPAVLALQGQTASADDLEVHQPTKIIPLETWSTPVYDEHGQIIQAIVAFQDITERKQAEQDRIRLAQEQEAKNVAWRYTHEIEAKNAALEKLNQEINEFMGIAAHDLKNPLSGIRGAAELIQADLETLSKADISEYMGLIHQAAQRMFQLIANLLDVNAIESGKFNFKLAAVEMSPLVQTVLNNYLKPAQAKNIEVHWNAPLTPLIAWLDKNTGEQILDNLISNAIKYSPVSKPIYIRLLQTEQTVCCEIQDEGPGLSEKDQQKLFGKFAKLTAQPTAGEHSTGLGLFIVKRLVTAMNGRVWCESELGKGTCFIVEFPKSQPVAT